ncbi:MAG TPA: endonuclease [Deltaproteobacteria bacterium]|nr:endonuclease [Deltaproteobacteria bacterium]
MMGHEHESREESCTSTHGFRVATYNVHGWIGTDSQQIPQRTLGVIKEMNCDIVGLQEATFSLESGEELTEDYLWKTTGMEPVLGPTLYKSPLYFGNVLLTRFPIHKVRRYDLTVSTFEPRGALDVELSCRGVGIRVLVTHLGLKIRERRRQMKLLLERVTEEHLGCIILMGDFNEWFLPRYAHRNLHTIFGFPPSPRTYPARFPLFAIDRIWVHPSKSLKTMNPWRTNQARAASDHLPVLAEISLSADGSVMRREFAS